MIVSAFSDLHGYFPTVEPCDIVCIAGDISPDALNDDPTLQWAWYQETFLPWAKALPCQYVVFIAGNHDKFVYHHQIPADEKVFYLHNTGVNLLGYSFYGTPQMTRVDKQLVHFPFSEEALAVYAQIPDQVDFLLTHVPPFDVSQVGMRDNGPQQDIGSKELRQAILDKQIGYIFCGHIHTGNHVLSEWRGKKIVNVALTNDRKVPTYTPFVLHLAK